MTVALLTKARVDFHASLLGNVLFENKDGVLSNADKGNKQSVAIARGIADRMRGELEKQDHLIAQKSGKAFEEACSDFVVATFRRLSHLRPGTWLVGRAIDERRPNIADFEQYSHLHRLYELAKKDAELRAVLQTDYLITPDVIIARTPEPDSCCAAF